MKTALLGTLAEFKHGSTPSKSEPKYWDGDIPWASSRDIKTDLLKETSIYVTEHAVTAAKLPLAPTGSLLVVVRSGILAHTVPVAEVQRPMAFNQDIAAIIPDPTQIHAGWLRLFIKSRSAEILQDGIKSGATVQSFRSGYLKGLRVPLIPVAEQVAITQELAGKLADIATCKSGAESQVADSSRLSAAILEAEFKDGPPVSVMPHPTTDSRWGWHKLASLARLESGHTPSRRRPEWWGGDVPWLALPDIRKLHGKVAHATSENTNAAGLANSSARLLPVGTVCVSRTASVGYVTMLGRSMATSQDFCNWVCDPGKLDPDFLMYAFMASQKALQELGSGAVHKSIYMPTIQSFHLCAPDIDEQRRIARALRDRLAAAEALTTVLKARLADIERLPQRLLAAAFGQA